MFSFFHRMPKITIDAFTWNSAHYETNQLDKASRHIPSYLKDMPSENFGTTEVGMKVPFPTMKRCHSIMKSFNNSFVVKAPFELLIKSDENNIYYHMPFEDNSAITVFSQRQKGKFDIPHFKWNTSWHLREKSGVDFILNDFYWHNFNAPWRVMPGILEFKYQGALNINMAVDRNSEQFSIEVGRPISQLIALSDKRVEIKHHLIDPLEWDRLRDLSSYGYGFVNKYGIQKKMRKENEKT